MKNRNFMKFSTTFSTFSVPISQISTGLHDGPCTFIIVLILPGKETDGLGTYTNQLPPRSINQSTLKNDAWKTTFILGRASCLNFGRVTVLTQFWKMIWNSLPKICGNLVMVWWGWWYFEHTFIIFINFISKDPERRCDSNCTSTRNTVHCWQTAGQSERLQLGSHQTHAIILCTVNITMIHQTALKVFGQNPLLNYLFQSMQLRSL